MPLVEELIPAPDPEAAFSALATLPHCLFLDSAQRHENLGRYSFLAADPFQFLQAPVGDASALDRFTAALAPYNAATAPGLPPFQGGAAGMLSYDLGRIFEKTPPPRYDEFNVPALAMGLYDVVLAFDHAAERAWIISQGLPELDPPRRVDRAAVRLKEFRARLSANPSSVAAPANRASLPRVAASELAKQFTTGAEGQLTSDFSASGYQQAVQQAIDYIYAGDVFQVNLSQRLLHPAIDDSVVLYQRLRQRNPATFSGYFDLGDFQIVSASPERFASVHDGWVEARPIKGTRKRSARAEADLFAGDDLLQSEKDRAENVMIVDLLRNDLSRVCRDDSVTVTELCRLETYEFVQHLVSVVRGRLAAGCGPLDVVRSAFPGGSITGAPKVRAMQIIAELEPTARGPYCGCLGYVGFNGALDLSILIRTIIAGRGWWQLPVGGGIVAQSTPPREYEETWHKAEGLLRALH